MKKQLTEKDVTFKVIAEEEQIPIEGNAMASGDDAADRRCYQWIRRQLNRGNVWAWAAVTVEAHYGPLVGRDHLGGCSYKSERDFCQPGGYFDDMKVEALADLQRQIDEIAPLVCGG